MNKQKVYNLFAEKREITGKKVKSIRAEGIMPAVLYGHKVEAENISIPIVNFEKTFSEAGTSSLIDLVVGSEKPVKVLSHEPQNDPVTGRAIHVDFYRVKMDKKIKTEIPLNFIGESEAVEQLEGSLVTNKDTVEVECLPTDLVSEIDVDISSLKIFDDVIKVTDLNVPTGIEILHDKEEIIALVEKPRSEEELAELEETSAADEEKEALEKMEAEGQAEEGIEAEDAEDKEGEAMPSEKNTDQQKQPENPEGK